MDLSQVHQGVHRLPKKKRVGRGIGSGHGKTSTRGSKGQGSRAGTEYPSQMYEGGQIPYIRRMPKRGFNNNTFRKTWIVVNVGDVDALFESGATIDLASLRSKGLANGPADGVRVLGEGDVSKKFAFKVNHVSKSAEAKIKAQQGTIELVPPPKKPVKNKMKPRPPKAAK